MWSRSRVSKFALDETGAGTVMGLMWVAVVVGITGLAVDIAGGYRNLPTPQGAVDSAPSAGAIAPPGSGDVAAAVSDSAENLNLETDDHARAGADLEIGAWDPDRPALTFGPVDPDAEKIPGHRALKSFDDVASNFLRMAGLDTSGVAAATGPQRFFPGCLREGLIARKTVEMSSGNVFTNDICIHGQQGVEIASGNSYETGVTVSMYDLAALQDPASSFDTNTGLRSALRERALLPRAVNHIDEHFSGILNLDPAYVPDYILKDAQGDFLPVIEMGANFIDALPGRIYLATCDSSQANLVLPANMVLTDIVLIADCKIAFGANSSVRNSFIGSRSGAAALGSSNSPATLNRGDADITAAAGVEFGVPDDCAVGGGVKLFSNATMSFPSSTSFNGVQLVALGDISLGAAAEGIKGISAQSGGTIKMTSANQFGQCNGGAPNLLTVDEYRVMQ